MQVFLLQKSSLNLLPGCIFTDSLLCFYPKLKISSTNNHTCWNKEQNFNFFYIQNRGKIYMWTSTSDNQEFGTEDWKRQPPTMILTLMMDCSSKLRLVSSPSKLLKVVSTNQKYEFINYILPSALIAILAKSKGSVILLQSCKVLILCNQFDLLVDN